MIETSSRELMENMRVIDDEICFRAKEARSVWNLFQKRAYMHREVYTHAKVKPLELMMADAFLLADNYVGISQHIHSPEFFWKLDDGILKAIETSDPPELEEASFATSIAFLKRSCLISKRSQLRTSFVHRRGQE
ncbi:unnamed protein product [Calypogeia fissa]